VKDDLVLLSIRASFLLLAAQLLIFTGWTANWPAWRGPEGTGVTSEEQLPVHWSTNKNVRWRTPLSEPGNSTPIVWENRIFLTQTEGKQRTLVCLDRANGKKLWQAGALFSENELTHDTNPQSSPSPVTDGERVIAWFGSAGLFCYDFQGKELWRRELGSQRHIWGYGASPVIHRDLCILNFGPGERSFLIAVDKKTGKTIWQVDEPGGDSGEKKPGSEKAVWTGSWSTPIIIEAAGREELVLSWSKRVAAYNPLTGKEFWTCSGLNPLVYTSPIYDKEKQIIVVMGGYNGMAFAVRAGSSGDVTETHRLWHHPKTKQRIGSGVIHAGHIYILNDPGIAECFELETGKLVWEERLKGPAAKSDNWSSLVLAKDKLYVVNQGGDAFVLKASPQFKVLATNSLAEPTIASMAVSNGEIFIRTYQALWCIAQPGK
jgi:outer membrane protein assembly factor BamB